MSTVRRLGRGPARQKAPSTTPASPLSHLTHTFLLFLTHPRALHPQTIATGDLDDLKRAPRCQARYDAWAAGVRKEWGGLEAFVRAKRLGWPEDPPVAAPLAGPSSSSSSASGSASSSAPALTPARREWPEKSIQHLDGSGRELRHFVDGLPDELAKCIPNDWPYGIPFGCEHYVVW